MNTIRQSQILALLISSLLGVAYAQEPTQHTGVLDIAKIEQLTGAKGKLDTAENAFKVTVPRSDLAVTVAGVKMTAATGFTSWAAFSPVGDKTMVMGDMVLQEDQINPVMSSALENGIEVTALHNHFLWDTPKVMFMHIGGSGDAESLATSIGKVFAKIKETSSAKTHVKPKSFDAGKTSLDPKPIETIIGAPVEKTGEVYKVTIGRTTQMDGHPVGKTMGVNTWAVFAGSNDKAIVEGDFAVLETKLQGVLKALRGAGIAITTIHNHMVGESPRIVFLHYWGEGIASDLAKAFKAALDAQSKT
ncbi:hypothetical protein A1359_15750 [Methylomonas lenta]|jgi:hypothetical protein|uniref:Peptidase M23 n=1 Tax=Methylomonas lenta TaxID=980561 RepID=A0A177MYQ4_9GAMM|nr:MULTISPECIES: DUF1259 domain-containing protein [Methylomonas]MCK9607975.1 DUF1259 domain-containing protein [Methylomonas sp.]OAI10715.1 hypothetical protein A1359_15750 [Methylomonas lenta]